MSKINRSLMLPKSELSQEKDQIELSSFQHTPSSGLNADKGISRKLLRIIMSFLVKIMILQHERMVNRVCHANINF